MIETTIVPVSSAVQNSPALSYRLNAREFSAEAWIEVHGSGTLRKNGLVLGMGWRDQYLQERTAHEFGAGFEIVPRTRIMAGTAYTESDEPSVTEAGWHCERKRLWPFPEDVFEVAYIQTVDTRGQRREGIGLLLQKTSASWVPDGHTVFAIVAPYDTAQGKYRPAINPW